MRTARPLFAALALGIAAAAGATSAQEMTFFRIGTGGIGGTYYPVGGMIAHAISNPPESRPCEKGGSCGAPGLVAFAQSTHSSVANVKAIEAARLKPGVAQSDVAYWAYSGTGIFAGAGRIDGLRAIASLYPESIHLVARKGAGISSVRDLRGKRVSLDELVYRITKALWNGNTRKLLDNGHLKGRSITLATALDGVGIPLHPGAERFYREVGLIK